MKNWICGACLWMAMAVGQAQAQTLQDDFAQWLQAQVWPAARTAGVSRGTFDSALAGVRLDLSLPDLDVPGVATPPDRQQAEFRPPAGYFAASTLQAASSTGARMATKHKALLQRIEERTGVPGRILLAIWGRESSYGNAPIPHDVFDVLATKGFLSRRAEYFTAELIAALQMVEAGVAPRSGMKSSWAGALGQPQFMPSSYLAHAADGDGDGRADIWTSEEDTLASIASYLAHHGWQAGRDWGFEVTVPAGLSCTLEGPDRGRSITDWQAMGVARVSGRAFPAAEAAEPGFLLMPAGRLGPAFIVTANFYVLKRYNESDVYALFVGHVGDRISYGIGDFGAGWKPVDPVQRSAVVEMQRALESTGSDVGGVDGLIGYKTRRAIGDWQERAGMTPTCYPDSRTVAAITRQGVTR